MKLILLLITLSGCISFKTQEEGSTRVQREKDKAERITRDNEMQRKKR